jgi:serine/threonine protein kinase
MHPDPNPRPPVADHDSAVDLTSTHTHTQPVATTPLDLDPVPGRDPAPGDRLGQYRLLRQVGAGGMGIVYEAQDEWLGRTVALKVLRSGLPAEQIARARFLREARAMAAIDHPNVVTIYQVGEASGRPYMAMQFLAGETLESRLGRDGRLPPAEVARIGREIAAGLAVAHAQGLVHRDVKPANVWLEAGSGRVRLLDFGLALARDSSHLTHSGYVIGTPAFMSPEQARGEPLDGRSDLFSLGTVLYLITTGERPFEGPTILAVMRNLELHFPTRVNVKREDVPAALSNLIMELLSKDPKDRPHSAENVAARLGWPEMGRPSHLPVAPSTAVPSESTSVHPPGRSPTMDRKPAPTGSAIRVLILVALLLLGVGAYLYYSATNYGRLEIETDVPEAMVQVRQDGTVKLLSQADRPVDLRPGSYELVLTYPKRGYKLTRTTIEVRRKGREVVRVIRDRP